MNIFLKIVKWVAIVLLVAFLVVVIYRAFVLQGEKRTAVEVEKIHATKLSLEDVMGDNLPPNPGERANDTIEGIDANKNGIRDDVELAIFEKYPDSAKTRAALLQYALALQMEMTQDVVNEGTVVAVAQVGDKALNCIWSMFSRDNLEDFVEKTGTLESFIERLQVNTAERDRRQSEFYNNNLGSYSSPNEGCDLDLSELTN